MYRIWFERPLPVEYAHLLDGVALPVGPASATPEAPLVALREAHGIIASSQVRYDGALMDQAPTLRVIARTGIGLDNVCIADATARGIAVCYAPDAPTISTAEHAVTLMLACLKRLKECERQLRRGEKIDFFGNYRGAEIHGLHLGLVGLGRIGRHVAKIALALGTHVVGFDPYVPAEQVVNLGIEPASTLDAMLQTSDIVSLHVPLTPETRHLMNAQRLAQLKPGAFLINTARGGLVDEAALLDALESGRLQGAGLDVFDPEPPGPSNPLLQREDVICTPHIGGATLASKDRLWNTAITQVLQVLRGERPPYLVNEEVWPVSGRPEGEVREWNA
ncbi:MAG TPA: hydroxyacid dehydrogenase [Chloroflexi bacterium]|nr:hydroxyacid dehydrogenase [Chloroflexota bacterium]